MPPSPLLFQHRVGPEHKEFNIPFVNTLITDAIARTGLVGVDGHPVHFTPHDFRRMFITDVEMSDVPFDASFGTVRDQGAAREIGHDAVGVGA